MVMFLNWLRISCAVSITTVAYSDLTHIRTPNFWADFKQHIIDRATNEKHDFAPVSKPKDCTSNTCWTFDTTHCSDKTLFNRFNSSVHNAASTVEWRAYLRVLEENRFSWYTAV